MPDFDRPRVRVGMARDERRPDDGSRLDWLQKRLEAATRSGTLQEELHNLGLSYLFHRDIRLVIDEEIKAESIGTNHAPE